MEEYPNILWICPDQQRADTIGGLGNPAINTPNIDSLVEEGVAFTNAYSQNPLCQPSRASFLTGRYPRTVGVRQNGQKAFPAKEKLITKDLSENGYECGLVGKLHLSAAQGRVEPRPDDGYSFFRWNHDPFPEPNSIEDDDYHKWLSDKGIERTQLEKLYEPEFVDERAYNGLPPEIHQTTWAAEQTMEFIKKAEEPWLLSMNIFDPHHPFDPPKKYFDELKRRSVPEPNYKEGELSEKPFPQSVDHEGAYGGLGISFEGLNPEERRNVTRAYYAMIEQIDSQVGRVLSFLEKTGQRENTLVIYMSDHGEMLGDHGIYWKGPYFYEGSSKVPLIFSWPARLATGIQNDALVELVDIYPTLLELLGREIPERLQGDSFAGLLLGKKDSHKNTVYSEYYNSHPYKYRGEDIYATMLRNESYKLTVYHGFDGGELYDLRSDPKEYKNLWNSKPEKRNDLLKKCFDRSKFNVDPMPKRVAEY